MKNNYRIEGDIAYIEIKKRDGTLLETLIDLEDLELVSSYPSWHAARRAGKDGYYVRYNQTKEKHRTLLLHRVVMQLEDPILQVDHKKHNTMDNRKSQLRIVTNQENGFNARDTRGYYWSSYHARWHARIALNGRQMYLGLFRLEEDARNAYLAAKARYHIIGGD